MAKVLTLNASGQITEQDISVGGGSSDIFSKEELTISDLSTNSGFVNVENGIKGGALGTENFTVSFPNIDYTRKFRLDVIIKINDASTANAKINILKNGNTWEGTSYLEVSSGALAINKTHTNSQGVNNIQSNSTFQYSIIGNGKRVIRNVLPLSTKWNGSYATTFLPNFDGQIITQTDVYNYNPSGNVEVFKDINTINVVGTNTSQIVIESINVQYFDNTEIYEHKKHLATLMDISVLNDALDNVYPSYLYCPPNSKALIQWHHPNGFNGTIETSSYGTFFSNLYNDGYAICYGTFNSFNNPTGTSLWGAGVTSSNWGAPAGLVYRKELNDYVDSLIKAEYYIQIGGSMGAFNALSYTSHYPDKIKKVVGISGALNLTYNYNNNFTGVINKAYGSAYRCILASTNNPTSNATYWVKISNDKNAPSLVEYNNPFYDTYSSSKAYVVGDVAFENYTGVVGGLAGFDLILNPRNLTKLPILLIHGDSDTIINSAQSLDFKNAVNAVGGDVTLNIKPTYGHLDIPLFDYELVDTFLNDNSTTSSGIVISGNSILNFDGEQDKAINTIANTSITLAGIKSISFIPIETTETSIDDFTLNGVDFKVVNVIDNLSFDIIGSAVNNASGNYTVKYIITI
jgi:pimeloyl-ACP methyl ester carboxylesterase